MQHNGTAPEHTHRIVHEKTAEEQLQRVVHRLRPVHLDRCDTPDARANLGLRRMPAHIQTLFWRRAMLLDAITAYERRIGYQFEYVLCARPDLYYALPLVRLLGSASTFVNQWDYAFVTDRALATEALGAFHSLRRGLTDKAKPNYLMARCDVDK